MSHSKRKIAIGLQQESHLTNSEHMKSKKELVGQVFTALHNNGSMGVTVLINKDIPIKIS